MLYITFSSLPPSPLAFPHEPVIVAIPEEHAPSFRSAINEIRNELGERVAGMHNFDKEDALTRAVSAIGTFAGGVNRAIPKDDKDYA